MKSETPTGTSPHDAPSRMTMVGIIDGVGARAATPADWPRSSMIWPTGREEARPAAQATPAPPMPAEGVLYTLAEACERHRVSYSTVTQAMIADKRLYSYGVQVGAGTERRTRLYTDADFIAMLRARQTLRVHKPRKISGARVRKDVPLSLVSMGENDDCAYCGFIDCPSFALAGC
jgi:hypothetical protein